MPKNTSHEPLPSLVALTRDDLRVWLSTGDALSASGDERFADDGETAVHVDAFPADKPLKPAAVLILVVGDAAGGMAPSIVFTQRTAHLTDHAGQISFPGGRVEPGDRDAAATALREAHEETGVDPASIEVLGTLPHYITGTGYRITPVVAWTHQQPVWQPDPREVEAVFQVPAMFLLDPDNQRDETAMYKGRMRRYYAIPFQQRYIWGATAGMLVMFARVLARAQGMPLPSPRRVEVDSA